MSKDFKFGKLRSNFIMLLTFHISFFGILKVIIEVITCKYYH